MRTFKFRAWDIEARVMYFPEEIIFNKDKELIYVSHHVTGHQDWDKVVLMQFTGTHSFNPHNKEEKTEIWEDDIVETRDGKFRVVFLEEWGMFKLVRGDEITDINMYDRSRRVIGNFWEDPELLEKR